MNGGPQQLQQFSRKQDGTSLVVQWLRLCTSTAEGTVSIPGWGTKIPHAMQHRAPEKKLN